MKRREFLQFLGTTGVLASLPFDLEARSWLSSLPTLAPTKEDKFITLDGINWKILLRWRDEINQSEKFGFNNDFIAFHELGPDNGVLWVNHEYVAPLFASGLERNKTNIDVEMKEVGGSLIEIKKTDGAWGPVKSSSYNRRLDGNTAIPFAWHEPIKGSSISLGTMGNCAGGYTPWGTVLTAEENFDIFWGNRFSDGSTKPGWLKWDSIYPRPPEHYGWIVEVEPKTGKAKKLVSLGRCAHECATVTKAKNGRVVAYTGDDSPNEHLYKFISDTNDSLERGKLYVADIGKGEWVSLQIDDQPKLKEKFKTQTNVQIYMREAAKLVGATPLDRPEDIEIDPLTGNVFITLTNNKTKGNYLGSILKIEPANGDHGSLLFKSGTALTGGKESGFACPDNLAFDKSGNLWFTTDMAGKDIRDGRYKEYGNNSLFVFLRTGNHAGRVIRVASGPTECELTGPCFSPDQKTLFLSVQHPGEETTDLTRPTSTWPDGGTPKPCVVTLQGPLLDKIVNGNL